MNTEIEIENLRKELAEKDAEIGRLKEESRLPVKYYQPGGKGPVYAVYGASSINFTEYLLNVLAAGQAQLRVLVESAFRDGFRSPETYNDTVLNSEDDAWRKSDASRALATPSDTTALEALIAKASEVMLERWLRSFDLSGLGNAEMIRPQDVVRAISAIPGVTLEDLK